MNIIISDLDGTLIHQNEISEKNLRAIHYWKSKGNIFTIATGRSFSDAKKYINSIKCNFPVILYNGNMIYDVETNDKTIMKTICDEFIQDLIYTLEHKSLLENLVLFGMKNNYVLKPNDLYLAKLSKKDGTYIINEDYRKYDDVIMNILIYSSPEIIEEVAKLPIYNDNVEILYNKGKLIDIVPKEVSKGQALRRIIEGIEFDKVYVVGDNVNDMSLAFDNNIVVAVKNATKEFKDISNLIVSENFNDAICELIQKIEGSYIEEDIIILNN